MYGIWDRHSRLPVRGQGLVVTSLIPGALGNGSPSPPITLGIPPGTHTGGTRVGLVGQPTPRQRAEQSGPLRRSR